MLLTYLRVSLMEWNPKLMFNTIGFMRFIFIIDYYSRFSLSSYVFDTNLWIRDNICRIISNILKPSCTDTSTVSPAKPTRTMFESLSNMTSWHLWARSCKSLLHGFVKTLIDYSHKPQHVATLKFLLIDTDRHCDFVSIFRGTSDCRFLLWCFKTKDNQYYNLFINYFS